MAQEGRDEKGKFTIRNMYHLMRERVGCPLKFDSPEALAEKAVEYFEWSDECDKGKYTSAGLRLYIGATRQTWHNYKNRPDFFDTIDHIETILEDFNEKKLQWAGSTQGAIFWLKNKASWKDESTVNENVNNVTANFGTAKKDETS
jgi:hypothetical protein